MKTQESIKLMAYAVLGLVAIMAASQFGIIPGQVAPVAPLAPGVPAPVGVGFGQLVSYSVRGVRRLNGTAENVNVELWSSDGSQVTAETNAVSALTSLGTTLPNTFSGYVMMGNDNYESSTDRGDEVYYIKFPKSWSGVQGLITDDTIYVDREDTSTGTTAWTFYDDNTAETTANISIASGGTYTAASVKLKSASDVCTGNPAFNGQHPIVFCFNETDAGDFKEIKPLQNDGKAPVPGWTRGLNVVDCYYIPTDAICDGNYFTTDLYFELNSGESVTAAGTDSVYLMMMDRAFYKNDLQKWTSGYGDESDLVADTDVGISSEAHSLRIYNTGI